MAQVQTTDSREVARPLNVLIPLIKEDFEMAEKAGMEYYKKAGELLLEAREGHFEGDTSGFFAWEQEKFGKSPGQLRIYMALVRTDTRKPFKTIDDFKRRRGQVNVSPVGRVHRDWRAPVDDIAKKARNDALRIAQDDVLTRYQEREAERKLAHRLIDIGFKVLAKELHPDKLQGDRDAMRRLNRVREILKKAI